MTGLSSHRIRHRDVQVAAGSVESVPADRTSVGIRTTLHKLRHYSATELIRAGVDVRTVAGRLGHSGATTAVTYCAAWVQEADQRACQVPVPPAPPSATTDCDDTACPATSPSPNQVLVAELRTAIRDGIVPAGTILPTVKQLGARHHVTASTTHRAVAVLAAENLVTVSRGCRAIVTQRPPTRRSSEAGTITERDQPASVSTGRPSSTSRVPVIAAV